jgi:hypothetical protein
MMEQAMRISNNTSIEIIEKNGTAKSYLKNILWMVLKKH